MSAMGIPSEVSRIGPSRSGQLGEGGRRWGRHKRPSSRIPEDRSRRRGWGSGPLGHPPHEVPEADLAEGPEGTGLLRGGEPGVHQPAQGRFLPGSAVVVAVFCLVLVPPGRVLRPGQPADTEPAGAQAPARDGEGAGSQQGAEDPRPRDPDRPPSAERWHQEPLLMEGLGAPFCPSKGILHEPQRFGRAKQGLRKAGLHPLCPRQACTQNPEATA